MKILHVIPSIDPKYGGPSRAVLELGELSCCLGDEVHIAFGILNSDTNALNNIEREYPDINFHPFSFSFPKRFGSSRSFKRWLRKNVRLFNFVSIHGIYSLISLQASFTCEENRIPYIVRPAGSLDQFDLQKKRVIKYSLAVPFVRKMIKNAMFIHCVSEQEAKQLQTFRIKQRVVVLPLPITPVQVRGNRENFRNRFGLNNEDFVFLFMSRIDYKKGLDLLIPAVSELSRIHPNLRLAIAGVDLKGYEKKVRNWISDYGVNAVVRFCGFLTGNEKLDAFAGADCFVLPSMNENFGVAVVEALQSGLPVLISNNVYIHDQILMHNGGWVCEYSLQSLIGTMRHVLSDPEDYKSKQRCAISAGEFYATRNLINLYKEFYKKILS